MAGVNISCILLDDRTVSCNGSEYVTEKLFNYTETLFWIYLLVYLVLASIAGLVSGLTLALLSMDRLEIEILQEAGTQKEQKMARQILPLVRRRHLLLVTLVLANSAAVEAMPVVMETFAHKAVTIIVSTTLVLIFGELLPQAVCSRKGLQVGAHCRWFVWLLIGLFFIIAYPFAKLLDKILGAEGAKFYNRGELIKLVELHGKSGARSETVAKDVSVGNVTRKQIKDGLTKDEVTIITGVLEMKNKTPKHCMIHIEKVFSLNIKDKVDKETIEKIILSSHSRVPLYRDNKANIVGMVLVKNLLLSNWSGRAPTFEQLQKESHDAIRVVRYVSRDINLLELLNLFQTGRSHLVVVLDVERNNTSINKKIFGGHPSRLWADSAEGEVLGIITLEDVIEELIQEEIIDETDKFVDVEKQNPVEDSSLAVDPLFLEPHALDPVACPGYHDEEEKRDKKRKQKKRRKPRCCCCCIRPPDSDSDEWDSGGGGGVGGRGGGKRKGGESRWLSFQNSEETLVGDGREEDEEEFRRQVRERRRNQGLKKNKIRQIMEIQAAVQAARSLTEPKDSTPMAAAAVVAAAKADQEEEVEEGLPSAVTASEGRKGNSKWKRQRTKEVARKP